MRILRASIIVVLLVGAGLSDTPTNATSFQQPVAGTNRLNITLSSGIVFRNCRLLRSNAVGVTYLHSSGVATILYGELPAELQAEFGYDANHGVLVGPYTPPPVHTDPAYWYPRIAHEYTVVAGALVKSAPIKGSVLSVVEPGLILVMTEREHVETTMVEPSLFSGSAMADGMTRMGGLAAGNPPLAAVESYTVKTISVIVAVIIKKPSRPFADGDAFDCRVVPTGRTYEYARVVGGMATVELLAVAESPTWEEFLALGQDVIRTAQQLESTQAAEAYRRAVEEAKKRDARLQADEDRAMQNAAMVERQRQAVERVKRQQAEAAWEADARDKAAEAARLKAARAEQWRMKGGPDDKRTGFMNKR